MTNMKHCRFENTYKDLLECRQALRNEGGIQEIMDNSNQYEAPYVKKLVELCRDIFEEFEDELNEFHP